MVNRMIEPTILVSGMEATGTAKLVIFRKSSRPDKYDAAATPMNSPVSSPEKVNTEQASEASEASTILGT